MKKRFSFLWLPFLAALIFPFSLAYAEESSSGILDRPFSVQKLENGHLLIADGGGRDWSQEGSEIIEVDKGGEVVWSYQDNLLFAHTAILLKNGNILIANTGLDEVLEVNREKEVVWSSDDWGEAGMSDGTWFNYPNDVEELENGHFLVTDRNNDRLLEIDREGEIFWEKKGLARPHNADMTSEGTILVSDSEGNRVIELDEDGKVVWEFGQEEEGPLYWPRDVDLLENGNLLITDSRNHRVVEINREGEIKWYYDHFLSFPYEADRLPNGNTLIVDSSHARVIEVDSEGKIVWEFRNTDELELSTRFRGSFEKDLDEDGWPDNWFHGSLLAESGGSFEWDDSVFKDGQKSAKINAEGPGMIFWHQVFKVDPDQKYNLRGFIRTQELEGFARFEVIFIDKLGGQIGITARTPDHLGTTGWERYETIFTTPKDAVAVDVWALVDGRGTAWFDEMVLKPVGWQRELGLRLSLIILGGGILIAIILNKFVR